MCEYSVVKVCITTMCMYFFQIYFYSTTFLISRESTKKQKFWSGLSINFHSFSIFCFVFQCSKEFLSYIWLCCCAFLCNSRLDLIFLYFFLFSQVLGDNRASHISPSRHDAGDGTSSHGQVCTFYFAGWFVPFPFFQNKGRSIKQFWKDYKNLTEALLCDLCKKFLLCSFQLVWTSF